MPTSDAVLRRDLLVISSAPSAELSARAPAPATTKRPLAKSEAGVNARAPLTTVVVVVADWSTSAIEVGDTSDSSTVVATVSSGARLVSVTVGPPADDPPLLLGVLREGVAPDEPCGDSSDEPCGVLAPGSCAPGSVDGAGGGAVVVVTGCVIVRTVAAAWTVCVCRLADSGT